MHPYFACIMRKAVSAPSPAIPAALNASAFKMQTNASATASFSLNSDGSCGVVSTGGPSAWITPVGGSYGGSYWAIVTITSGAVTSGTVGSRVAVGTGVTWTITQPLDTGDNTNTASGTIQIWDAAAAGNMVASGTFSLTATSINTSS